MNPTKWLGVTDRKEVLENWRYKEKEAVKKNQNEKEKKKIRMRS